MYFEALLLTLLSYLLINLLRYLSNINGPSPFDSDTKYNWFLNKDLFIIFLIINFILVGLLDIFTYYYFKNKNFNLKAPVEFYI